MATSHSEVFPPPESTKGELISSMEVYRELYNKSVSDPSTFWAEKARGMLSWFQDFETPFQGSFEKGDIAWFAGGKLNVSYNCIDRHVKTRGDQVAILWEGDEPGLTRSITYSELLAEVCKIANCMRSYGVKRGDTVAIYMPMVPEAAFVMLACARLGAVHSVVFAGFSTEALRSRIVDASSKWVFTCDEGKRGGRVLPLKSVVDCAVDGLECVEKVFCFKRTHNDAVATTPRDVWMDEELPKQRPYCPCEVMDSEDNLFILYTSGSTGTPKGVVHSSGGYLTYAAFTTKHTFDLREGDVYACVADVGWVTGHTYIVYGPLANGTTTLMFESTPLYPDAGRYWDLVERHKVTQFYTAPTAIRAVMKAGDEHVTKRDLSSLRVLGTVGEPINPEAWKWYYNVVGGGRCSIADTWWQTETGGHMMTPFPGVTPAKPGSATLPYLGISVALVDEKGVEVEGNDVSGVLVVKHPWPGMARTVWNNHERYLNVYMNPYPGYYFTGDGCTRDQDGYYWVTGRVDDVLNTSGHRLGTAEIESALTAHPACAECAVIGFPHTIKGEGICAYVCLAEGFEGTPDLLKSMREAVRVSIGAFASPDFIIPVPGLPKTRSGKIMRRILRKVIAGEEDQLGDISTLADPSVVAGIIENVRASKARAPKCM